MTLPKRTIQQTIDELQEIQSAGANLEEAVISLFKKENVGLLYLFPAIAEIENISKPEAKRLMVKWLAPYTSY